MNPIEMNILRPLRKWILRRRLRKLLDLPLEGIPGGDATGAAWSWYLLGKAFEDRTPIPKDTALAFRCYLRSAQAACRSG